MIDFAVQCANKIQRAECLPVLFAFNWQVACKQLCMRRVLQPKCQQAFGIKAQAVGKRRFCGQMLLQERRVAVEREQVTKACFTQQFAQRQFAAAVPQRRRGEDGG